MNKQYRTLTVILMVILLAAMLSLGTSAAGEKVCERITVETFDELKEALEVTTTQTNPPERLIVLEKTISNYKGEGLIEITYPGKIALDLNGKSITVTNTSTDSGILFYLGGDSEMDFTLVNTSATQSTVTLKSDIDMSALLMSDNPKANLSILSTAKYSSTSSTSVVSPKIILKTQAVDTSNTALHFTLYFAQADKVYISGTQLNNQTKNPCNIYFDSVPNSFLITGKSDLKVGTSFVTNTTCSNICFNSDISSATNIEFGSCTVSAYTNSRKVNLLKSFDNLNNYVISDMLVYDGEEKPEYIKIKSGNVVKSDWTSAVDIAETIQFVFRCCDNLETADITEEDTVAGHITKCNKCGGIVKITPHNFDPSTSHEVEPTCTTPGSKASCKCSDCDYSTASEFRPALGHTEVSVKGKEATCTETGLTDGIKCSVCNEFIKEQTIIPKKDHKNDIDIPAIEATCTKTGLTAGKKCSACGNVTVSQTEIPIKPHTVVADPKVEATCIKDGKTAGTYCSVCNTVIEAQKTIPATGHKEETVVEAKAPTCTEQGSTEKKQCSVCNTVTAEIKAIPALGHNIDKTNWVIDTEPSCIDKGSKSHHCTRCNYKEDITEMPSLNTHRFSSEWIVDKEPTCTENGSESRHCSRCDAKTDIREIKSKGGHDIVIDSAIDATCTTEGKTEGEHCSVCGEIIKKQDIIPASHTVVIDKAVAATCTKAGKTEGKHCSVCGTVIVAQKNVSATGHNNVAIKAVAATCDKNGLTAGTKCSVCGTVTKAQTTVKAKGHSYKTTTKKATLTANGSVVTKCTVCGKVKSNVAVSKIKTVKLSKSSLTYNGKKQQPTVTVKDNAGKTLKNGTDYTVAYAKGCKNVGQYTVTITFKGNYSGSKKLTFNIVPKGASVSKLTAGKKQLTVKWKKQATQTTGYEIQYSTKSNMKSAKTVTVNKTGTTSTTIKKLKSGKKYYVRIRTYKTVKIGGKNVKLYSAWSKVKNVKVK